MKRLLLLLFTLAFPIFLCAQTASQTTTFTVAANGASVGLAGTSVTHHQIQWWWSGTITTCTVELDGSTDGVTFGTVIISGQTCTSPGKATLVSNTAQNFVRINVTVLTGGGTLTVRYAGYNEAEALDITRIVTANAGTGQFNVTCTAANCPVNVAQINGVAPLMGNGVTGTGSPRVTVASDNSNAAGIGGSATGAAVPSAARYIAGAGSGAAGAPNLTGAIFCDNWTNINQIAGAQLITGVASKQTYICNLFLYSATAQNVALVEGTGVVCATGTAGLIGGATAATGQNLAANQGFVLPASTVPWRKTATAADNVCLLQSGVGQVSGVIVWAQF